MLDLERELKILLVEDNAGDAALLRGILDGQSAPYQIDVAGQLHEADVLLRTGCYDVLLLDLSLPDSDGLETLDRTLGLTRELPIVVLTGMDDETVGAAAIRRGAQDYMVKGQVDARLLMRAIRYARQRKLLEMDLLKARDELEQRVAERTAELEKSISLLGEEVGQRSRVEQELRESREQLQAMVEAMPTAFWMCMGDLSRMLYVNAAYEKLWGRSRQSIYEQPRCWLDGIHPDDRPGIEESLRRWVEDSAVRESAGSQLAYRIVRPDGSLVRVHCRTFPVYDNVRQLRYICGMVEQRVAEPVGASADR